LIKKMPGPPSYFTRRKDGFSVPSLQSYMQGYTNLFKAQISTKTLENSFNILNRQAWTNQKSFLSGKDEEGREGKCELCGERENTHHFLFECEEYAEGVWYIFSKAISEVENKNVQIHMFNVIYNLKIKGVGEEAEKHVFALIQECKRMLVKRRYDRCQNPSLNNIIYDERRIAAHWVNLVRGQILFQKYKGKNTTWLDKLQENLEAKV